MSSILKALKKLEQETAENAGTPLMAGVRGRPKKRPGSLVVPGLIAFTLFIFAGVGIAIFNQNASVFKSTGPESAAVLEKDEKPVFAEKIPAEKIPAPKKAAAIDNRKPPKTAAVAPKFEFATAPVKTADPFSPIMPEPDVVNEKRLSIDEDPEPAAAFQPEVVADESSAPDLPDMRKNTFTEKPVVKKAEPLIAVIKDPSVELQAISWSTDPDKRLAIINGKICREKDHVDGYMIQAIKPDEVILTKGTVKGKLVFDIR